MKKGFSLVELIIVIAVIGVLAAILIPTFTNVINKSNEKSALSDARNVMTTFISTAQAESTSGVPNLIAVVRKGGKLFAFAYLKSGGKVINQGANPFPYNDKASVTSNAYAILAALELAGACTPSADPAAAEFTSTHVKTFVERAGYSMEDMAVFTEYDIDEGIFTADAKLDIGVVPDDPIKENVVIVPIYDPAKEIYTFTITTEDAARLQNDEDGKIELDMSGVFTDLYGYMSGEENWYGYSVMIKDEAGLGISSVDIAARSDKLSGIISGGALSSSDYPYITKSEAFTAYMNSIGYASVNESTAQEYVNKAKAGTLPKTYAQYLKEEYGSNIPLETLSTEVAKGATLNVRHAESSVAKMLFNLMYDNGFVYSFIPSNELNTETGAVEAFRAFANRYNDSKTSMPEGWKTAGSVKLYSAYDLVKNGATNANALKSGTFMFAWHENLVPDGTAYIKPDIKVFVTP